ncbi:MAG: aspartyl protease family protein [Candidatus Eremiobacteraeota bacterium]|nr:aspartyl protease family protein [Candidatus Eremiobacteraeota bacterium]
MPAHILSILLAALTPQGVLPLQSYLSQQETLTASVNGVIGTFLFDTGEGVTAISPDFAKRVGCKPWGRVTGFRMSGERGGYPHCDNLTFVASGRALHVPSAIILDVMKLMGPDITPRVDGAIGLDAFAGAAITIVPRTCIVLETAGSLKRRTASARRLAIRFVRDAEGVAFSVDAAVPTTQGTAWMELDSGNGGSLVIANYIAPLLGLPMDVSTPMPATFKLSDGIEVSGPTRTRDLIMDGNIGARFLNQWSLTLDLMQPRAWLTPPDAASCSP